MVQSPDSLVLILNFFMGFAYVIGLHNWMKKLDEKIPRTAKIRPHPICLLEEFFETKQNKTTKQHSQQQEAKSVRRRTAISQQDFF